MRVLEYSSAEQPILTRRVSEEVAFPFLADASGWEVVELMITANIMNDLITVSRLRLNRRKNTRYLREWPTSDSPQTCLAGR